MVCVCTAWTVHARGVKPTTTTTITSSGCGKSESRGREWKSIGEGECREEKRMYILWSYMYICTHTQGNERERKRDVRREFQDRPGDSPTTKTMETVRSPTPSKQKTPSTPLYRKPSTHSLSLPFCSLLLPPRERARHREASSSQLYRCGKRKTCARYGKRKREAELQKEGDKDTKRRRREDAKTEQRMDQHWETNGVKRLSPSFEICIDKKHTFLCINNTSKVIKNKNRSCPLMSNFHWNL